MAGLEMTYKAFISYSHAADDQLAPMLQQALQQFAKPFYRLRVIDVFRDKTSLQLTPALWPEIQRALQRAEFFVLLASPEAARSEWVKKEVEEWLGRGAGAVDKLLIVLTGGSIVWDDDQSDFDWALTDALPGNLARRFAEEPLYGDLRSIKSANELSLRNPKFLNEVATLSASLRGVPRDQLIGQDVRQHRIFRATLAATVAIVLALGAAAVGQALVATRERDRAEEQTRLAKAERTRAETERDRANKAREDAEKQRRLADAAKERADDARTAEEAARKRAEEAATQERAARVEAENNLRLATARRLAAQAEQALVVSSATEAIGANDPQRGVLLGLESLKLEQTPEGVRALRNAVARLRGEKDSPTRLRGSGISIRALGLGAQSAVVSGYEAESARHETAWAVDPRTGVRLREEVLSPATPAPPEWLRKQHESPSFAFGGTGKWLVDEDERGMVRVWDALARRALSRLPAAAGLLAVSDDGRLVANSNSSDVTVWRVRERKLILRLPHEWSLQAMSFTSDGLWLTTVTFDVSKDSEDNGATVLVGSTIRVWSTRTGALVTYEPLATHGGVTGAAFSPDGRWLATTSTAYDSTVDERATGAIPEGGDTILRVWHVDIDDLQETACALLRRNLSESERANFLGKAAGAPTCTKLSDSATEDADSAAEDDIPQ